MEYTITTNHWKDSQNNTESTETIEKFEGAPDEISNLLKSIYPNEFEGEE